MSEEIPWAPGGLKPGSRLAGYLLEEQVGRGGMAVVYRAYDDRLDRRVALKVLAPELARDDAFRRRFIQESRAAAAVDHPHIIPVFDAGEADGVLYLAMRYVPGGDVRMLLDRAAPLPVTRACGLIAQVASALDAAHARGLVHRDVKPTNMLLDLSPGTSRPDHVYLSDFGLAKPAAATSGVTMTGQFLGTVDYVAPEQIQGLPVDGRADQYSLACASFEMLCGTPPFRREHSMAVLSAQLTDPPPSLVARRTELPAAVDAVLARALAKAPEERYGQCLEFAEALLAACGIGTGRPATPAAAGAGQAGQAVTAADPAGPAGGAGAGAAGLAGAAGAGAAGDAGAAGAGAAGDAGAAGAGAAGDAGAAGAAAAGAAGGAAPHPRTELAAPAALAGQPGAGAAADAADAAAVPSPRQPGSPGGGTGQPAGAGEATGYPAGTSQPAPYAARPGQPAGHPAGTGQPAGYPAGAGQPGADTAFRHPGGQGTPGWWTNVSSPEPGGPPGSPGPAGPARRGRRRGMVFLLGVAVVLAGAAVAAVLLRGKFGQPQAAPTPTVTVSVTHSASPQPSSPNAPAPGSPASTVRAYFDAINNQDYARAWDLGGRNTGSSYDAFVNGFQGTSHDTVTILSVSGNVVTARVAARQTDGTVKTFQGSYQVTSGVITHFHVVQVS